MGQRHQTYIYVKNMNNGKDKKDNQEFGTGETTVLAFYNQWLYGRSPLFECAKVLRFAEENKHYPKDIYERFDNFDR